MYNQTRLEVTAHGGSIVYAEQITKTEGVVLVVAGDFTVAALNSLQAYLDRQRQRLGQFHT